MRKFNFKLVNGKNLNAELIDNDIVFENVSSFKAKHLIALRPLFSKSQDDFILDSITDIIIPNKTFLILLEALEEEIGYIHVRPTVDVINSTIVIDDKH